ncbi:MAG TPA: diguanylate cyclase [Cyanobacteria bacterium UBA8803]|nr:diguanylate cyclase [Cyanobacteria bacterium UBA9273]HBL57890.1 diguanylate cyclase [Cyanobacteria bacterium UBA8803]
MSDRDQSQEQLLQELALLRQQVAKLKITKFAFDAQQELLRTFITTSQTASGTLMIRALLQQISTMARKLTRAEGSSLFLLDADGVVIESILARGATLRGQKQRLIGQVLDKGLAGWVFRHRQTGLIPDTLDDKRWLTLPNQPYAVRSALSVPILQGKEVLAILTLMHSKPGHFGSEATYLIETTAKLIALILDNARLSNEHHQQELHAHQINQEDWQHVLPQKAAPSPNENQFSLIGMYILFGEGNFLYVSPRLAEIFGYTFGELISLESVLELVTKENREFFAQQINQCIQGQTKSLSCKFKGQRQDRSPIDVEVYGTRTKLYGKFVIIGGLRLL